MLEQIEDELDHCVNELRVLQSSLAPFVCKEDLLSSRVTRNNDKDDFRIKITGLLLDLTSLIENVSNERPDLKPYVVMVCYAVKMASDSVEKSLLTNTSGWTKIMNSIKSLNHTMTVFEFGAGFVNPNLASICEDIRDGTKIPNDARFLSVVNPTLRNNKMHSILNDIGLRLQQRSVKNGDFYSFLGPTGNVTMKKLIGRLVLK